MGPSDPFAPPHGDTQTSTAIPPSSSSPLSPLSPLSQGAGLAHAATSPGSPERAPAVSHAALFGGAAVGAGLGAVGLFVGVGYALVLLLCALLGAATVWAFAAAQAGRLNVRAAWRVLVGDAPREELG